MKRIVTVLGLVAALMIPASLAVAQADDAPETKKIRLGAGDPSSCSYYIEKGEPQMIRLQAGAQSQTGSRFGEGTMGSAAAPLQRQGFGPGECDGDGPFGPFGPTAEEAPYGPFGDQDGDRAGYGPATTGNGPGLQDGTGPIQAGTQDDIGNEFGPGPGENASAPPDGPANQNGAGPGGHK
jgi:hypothetical protein